MADIVDIANDKVQADLEAALRNRPASGVPQGTGACLYCDTALPVAQRWCDADCRDDWERDQKKPGSAVGE